jgi:hypothetical protein
MKILCIKTSGTTMTVPGIGEMRTPFSIDVSRINLDTFIIDLRHKGITDYEILEVDDISAPISQIKQEPKKVEKDKVEDTLPVQNNIVLQPVFTNPELEQRLKSIENMISRLIDSGINIDFGMTAKKSKIEEDEEVEILEGFVPSVNISGSIINKISSKSTTTENRSKDIAKSLKDIIKTGDKK